MPHTGSVAVSVSILLKGCSYLSTTGLLLAFSFSQWMATYNMGINNIPTTLRGNIPTVAKKPRDRSSFQLRSFKAIYSGFLRFRVFAPKISAERKCAQWAPKHFGFGFDVIAD
jgi:hypothetical protein